MDRFAIARRRMFTQRLWGPRFGTPTDVVRFFGAMQAQEHGPAKWSVAQRATGVDEKAMNRALAEGAILRTHLLRPTWHYVLPEDARWILDLTAPRVHQQNAYYYARRDLDGKVLAKASTALARAVEGGHHRTREELAIALGRAKIAATGERLGSILMHAELEKVLVSGAPRSKRHTYASFDERVPKAKARSRAENVAELVRRFFVAHGPATLKDFVRWSGLTVADGKAGLAALGKAIEAVEADGRTYYGAPVDAPTKRARRIVADLVQGYDEVIVAYTESKDVLFAKLASAPTHARVFVHALLVDGQLFGHWRQTRATSGTTLETSIYGRPSGAEDQALDAAIARYADYLGVPVTRP